MRHIHQNNIATNQLAITMFAITSTIFPFLFFLTICWYCGAGVFGLIGRISLSLSLALPTYFNNNNNDNNNNENYCNAKARID